MNDPDELAPGLETRIRDSYRIPPPIDPAARARLDRAIAAAPRPRRSSWAWLTEARPLMLQPATAIGLAALLVVAGSMAGRLVWPQRTSPVVTAMPLVPQGAESSRMVQFVLVAPGASSVALVGDFNGWDEAATPMRIAHDGETWTAALPVADGRHVYAFVVDGSRWMPDPVAPLAPEDEFGTRNSVLVVGGRGAS